MKIDKYNSSYFKSFVKLIDKCFLLKNKNKEQLVNWKFFSKVFDHKNKIICVYDKDKIVAQYSNIAFEFIINSKIVKGYLCQDMCVLKEYRGKGFISKMSKKLYGDIKEDTFTVGFSNKNGVKVDKNSKGYGYVVIDRLKKLYFLAFYKKKLFYNFYEINDFYEIDKLNFNEFNFFSEKFTFNKTKEYIIWRYFKKPNRDYKIYLLKDNNLIIGYVVVKINGKDLVIFDFNLKKYDNFERKKIINTFNNICLSNNRYIFTLHVLYNLFWKNLFKGFFKIKINGDNYFTLKNHNNFLNRESNLNKNNWIIISGDIL